VVSYNYSDAVELLTSVGKFRISLGLERISAILDLLGNPQYKINCIHIAGTNGKGSVCSIIASILNEAGKKVGLYTSPHLFKYTERIKTGNCHSEPLSNDILRLAHQNDEGEESHGLSDISDNDFAKYVFEVSDLARKNNIDLTEFEILTAVMFKYFADNKVDVAVLETGLGGRFDATNVIKKPLCCAITHVDFDHTERLGDTLDKIAYEKAGIMKKDCPCIVFEGKEVYYDTAREVGALLEVIVPYADDKNLALKGVHQKENLGLALAVIDKAFPEISQEVIECGLKNVKHPGRFQYIKEKNLIIDGAHNPNGIKSLTESLDFYYPNQKRRFIFGCLRNKDYKTMLKLLLKDGDVVYFYHFSHQNSAAYEELKAACPIEPKELKDDTEIDFNDGYLNIICGSLYMISELVERFGIKI
jgi:dihydrofolate synthase/folylpolyglutamate synthase